MRRTTGGCAPHLDSGWSRRTLLTGALGVAVLSACGEGEEPAAAPRSGVEGFPRSVEHGLGSTDVPAKPRRVVATADRDLLDVLLAMGVRPVFVGLPATTPPRHSGSRRTTWRR